MTDWTPEEDEAFNEVEKHSNLGKQILRDIEGQPYVYAPKREWVGLTDEEFKQIMLNTYNIDLNVSGHSSDDHLLWNAIEAKLKEKNSG